MLQIKEYSVYNKRPILTDHRIEIRSYHMKIVTPGQFTSHAEQLLISRTLFSRLRGGSENRTTCSRNRRPTRVPTNPSTAKPPAASSLLLHVCMRSYAFSCNACWGAERAHISCTVTVRPSTARPREDRPLFLSEAVYFYDVQVPELIASLGRK